MKLKNIDPLFLFLGVGVLLFAASAVIDPASYEGEGVITVDRQTLEDYLAAGGGEELATIARTPGGFSLAALDTSQKRELIDRYVEEQALYREAQRWGLDENDLAIRRRLGQSLRFALRPEVEGAPSEDALRRFYQANLANYVEPSRISFEHVYFDKERRGTNGAQQAAAAAIRTPLSDWQAIGDRYPYQRSYVAAGPAVVSSQLGEGFAEKVYALPADQEDWHGPVQSELGYHLVRVIRREQSTTPPFEQVRDAVLDDWTRAQHRQQLDAATDRIVAGYEADVDPAVLKPRA